MNPGTIPAITFAAVLALSSAVAYALPENYEARLREANNLILFVCASFIFRV